MWTISPKWLFLQSLACLSDGKTGSCHLCFLVYAQVLGTAPVGVEASLVGLGDQTLVPVLVAQLLERKQGTHKQPMTLWVRSAGSLEGS